MVHVHPLTRLREGMGLSQSEYAKLVARTHTALALGNTAARRERVSRWEAARSVPEHTAQLAMAHIHGIPAREVHQLGWPHWLHLATGDATLLDQPYTDHGAVLALRAVVDLSGARHSPELTLRGRELASHLGAALTQLADPGRTGWTRRTTRSAAGCVPGLVGNRLRWSEARTTALEQQEAGTLMPAAALYGVAYAEHRLVVGNLLSGARTSTETGAGTSGGVESPGPRRLFPLAARTALLCTWLSSALGEETGAERHNLAALRAAVATGDRAAAGVVMAQLATRHLIVGDAADARMIVRAARAADPEPAPAVAVVLHTREALALARLGRSGDTARALDRAADTLAADTPVASDHKHRHRPGFPFTVDDRFLTSVRADAWLHAADPRRAEPHAAALLDWLDGPEPVLAPPLTGRMLLSVVDTYLALGEAAQAVRATSCAIGVSGTLPQGLARQYHGRLAAHQHEPLIREALEQLAHGEL
ncbi:hypothetical protein [Kitasatospora sp. NPDC059160]|uniref:hypothetical protein n=1 Tax=Kitasatospora sp. NPDC059160 TaxID=3346748 RepID=UPI003686C493